MCAAGIANISSRAVKLPLLRNSFVVSTGVLIPMVWLQFVEEGLASWPYTIIFIWFLIFAFELTAFTCSVTNYALISAVNKPKNEEDDSDESTFSIDRVMLPWLHSLC